MTAGRGLYVMVTVRTDVGAALAEAGAMPLAADSRTDGSACVALAPASAGAVLALLASQRAQWKRTARERRRREKAALKERAHERADALNAALNADTLRFRVNDIL